MMFTCPPNAVVLAGRSLDLVAQAILEAQRWRARNGLPALDAYAKLLAAVTANTAPVAVDGHADSPAAPVVEAESMTTHEARIDLTRVAGVPPRRPRGKVGRRDFGLCFNVTGYDRPGEESWARWVRLAPYAELRAPSTITQLAELAHSDLVNPDAIAAVAADRHRQRTNTEED